MTSARALRSTQARTPTRALTDEQRTAWNRAQALWNVTLHEAVQQPHAHRSTFAWFSFPPAITVDPVEAERSRVANEWETIFAHEIGHHVLSPSTRIASLAITQQMARALSATALDAVSDLGEKAHYLGNLWSDMLINTRVVELQRRAQPDEPSGMERMWSTLGAASTPGPDFWVVLRAYEELWGRPNGTFCDAQPPAVPSSDVDEAAPRNPAFDASLLARTVRTFGSDPISGALRFGMVMAPYLLGTTDPAQRLCDGDATGDAPTARELSEVLRDPRLSEEPRHPLLSDADADGVDTVAGTSGSASANRGSGQGFGISETIALYPGADPDAVMAAWYLAEAQRWVRPYRQLSERAPVGDELPGAIETWELGDELEYIDWPASLVAGPRIVPGVTTRRRGSFLDDAPLDEEPVELDLYIDSSGSMPHPRTGSPAALAATILVLSVLRGGGAVRVTSFSSPGEVGGTARFSRNRTDVMAAVLLFFSGGTTFPLDLLAKRYPPGHRQTGVRADVRRHLAVLSDDGLSSMFGQGQEQFTGVAGDVRARLTTATLIVLDGAHTVADRASAAGYDVEYIATIDDAPIACAALASRITARQNDRSRRG